MKVLADKITRTVAPSAVLTTAEAKSHLRVDISTDDTLIDSMISAATDYCELYTGRSFVTRTYRADLSAFADVIELPMRPIISITSIKYYDTNSPSVLTTLASSTYNVVNNVIYRTFGASWPSRYPRMDSVQITFTAGYAPTSSPEVAAENVPDAVKAAILLIVGELYENRESSITGLMYTKTKTVEMLLAPYRFYQ